MPGEGQRVTTLELFFGLVFVFTIMQLTARRAGVAVHAYGYPHYPLLLGIVAGAAAAPATVPLGRVVAAWAQLVALVVALVIVEGTERWPGRPALSGG